jgi:hypothetical protein
MLFHTINLVNIATKMMITQIPPRVFDNNDTASLALGRQRENIRYTRQKYFLETLVF